MKEVRGKALTIDQLHHASGDDDEQSDQLRIRENVLHSGGPLHVPAVHER